jgi:hypothetical protein
VNAAAPRPPDPRHSRIVVRTAAIWVGLHVLLLIGIDAQVLAECRGSTEPTLFGGCGANVGLVALAIGWIQLLYGALAGVILLLVHRIAVAQGVFIASAAVAVLFTVLCFGAAAV